MRLRQAWESIFFHHHDRLEVVFFSPVIVRRLRWVNFFASQRLSVYLTSRTQLMDNDTSCSASWCNQKYYNCPIVSLILYMTGSLNSSSLILIKERWNIYDLILINNSINVFVFASNKQKSRVNRDNECSRILQTFHLKTYMRRHILPDNVCNQWNYWNIICEAHLDGALQISGWVGSQLDLSSIFEKYLIKYVYTDYWCCWVLCPLVRSLYLCIYLLWMCIQILS